MAHDIAELQAACVAAEKAKADLLQQRQANRGSMSRAEFIEYNEASRGEQLAVSAAVTDADKAFTEALDEVRVEAVHQVVDIGTFNEGNQPGGVSTDG